MTIVAADVIAWYDMSDGSGSTLTDDSGNGNNGTLSGATWSGTTVSANFDNSLEFNVGDFTGDDRVTGVGTVSGQTGGFTIVVWYRMNGERMMLWGDDDGTDRACFLWINQDEEIEGAVFNTSGSNNSIVGGTTGLSQNNTTWYMVALTYDGGTQSDSLEVWLNGGTSDGTAPFSGTLSSETADAQIGAREADSSNSNTANGLIQQVILFNRALTSAELDDLYNSGDGTTYADLFPEEATDNAVFFGGGI